MNTIITKNLEKKYDGKSVLRDVSISIEEGEIYALIGKNGAGKTTLMKLITGFIKPSCGEIFVKSKKCKPIGVLIETPGLLTNLSGYDNIKAKCICYNKSDRTYINSILSLVGLYDVKDKKVKKYSLGMKQRLGLALALVGDPEILVLDEPINGLDPQGIVEFRNILLNLNKTKNTTIIISSHILEELSKVASTFAFIDNGELLEEIKADMLISKCASNNISIENYYLNLIGENLNENLF